MTDPLHDGRWRRVRVSLELLSQFLRGQMDAAAGTTAPPDLAVLSVTEVQQGPVGWVVFVVWSATFDPVPMGDGRPDAPFPMIELEYTS